MSYQWQNNSKNLGKSLFKIPPIKTGENEFLANDQLEAGIQSDTRLGYPSRVNRHVFSLSYDLVDSTALMAHLGAESYSQLLSHLHGGFADIAARWHGRIDKPQGDDGCMCYFGAITANEHSGLACLQAALEMRSAALFNGWKIRIGVAEGWVAVDNNQPVGLSVHLAARLQKLAGVGNIAVTQTLSHQFSGVFEFTQLPAQTTIKGFEEVLNVAQLDGYNNALISVPRPVGISSEKIFIGRHEQIIFLRQAWQRACHAHGSEHLIIGPSGIGKSALIRHWLALDQIQACVLTCGPYDYRRPFASLMQWLAKELGFETSHEGKKSQTTSLQSCISRHATLHEYRYELSYLFDSSTQDVNDLFEDSQARHQQVIDAIIKWLSIRCKKSPVLIVVEDYQWIDASTAYWVNEVRELAGSGSSVMLVVTQRPALVRQLSYVTQSEIIEIERLNAFESRQLIVEMSPELSIDEELVCQLEINSQGIPLFLKESVRLFEAPEFQKKLLVSKRLGIGLPVPENLQNLLMERLDHIGSARIIAQLGSVFGGRFSHDSLINIFSMLYPQKSGMHDVNAACQLLIKEELWTETYDSHLRQFEFSHAMIRDVAYHSMWSTDRKNIHRLIAQVLQKSSMNDDDASAAEMGRHLAAAGETGAAVNHLLNAGKRSKKRGAHQVAKQILEAALDLIEFSETNENTHRSKMEAHLALAGQILVTQGYVANDVADHYMQALTLSDIAGDDKAKLRAQMGMQSFYFMRGNFVEAHRLMQIAKTTASRVENPFTDLQVEWALANLLFYEGQVSESCTLMEKCISRCKAIGIGQELIQNPQVMAMLYRGFSLWCLGRFSDALLQVQAGCELADAGTNRLARLQAYGIAAMVYYGCGFWAKALESANNAIASCQPGEYKLWLAHAHVMRGATLARLGSFSEGLAAMQENHLRWAYHGGSLTRSYYWVLEAELFHSQQDDRAAQTAIDAASQHLQTIPERYYASELLRVSACINLASLRAPQSDRHVFNQLLASYTDASERQLYGMSLRAAINLLELAIRTDGLASSNEDLSFARQRLETSLASVQHETATSDVVAAQALLLVVSNRNVVQIEQYKRA